MVGRVCFVGASLMGLMGSMGESWAWELRLARRNKRGRDWPVQNIHRFLQYHEAKRQRY